MLDFVRTHQRWLQFILLLLILPAFVLTGVASFSRSSSADVVAKVDTREITQQEFASRYQRFMENARRQMGDKFDATYYQSAEAKSAYLTQISNEALLEDLLTSGKMTASDMEVAQALARMQGMPKNAQGGIDEAAYKAALAQQGLTPAAHQFGVRVDLVKAQLSPAYSVLNLPVSSEFMKNFFGRARVVEVKSVDLTPYMAQATVTPEQIQAYYDQHKAQFNVPDAFDVDYTVIPVAGGGGAASSLGDEDIKAVFGPDATPEQLAKVRQDPNQSKVVLEKVVQKKIAAQLDAQITKAPQDVAAVAKLFNAKVEQAKGILRQAVPNEPVVFQDAKVREALLNATQAESKNIAPVMALPSGDLLVARVVNYRPAGVRSLDEVKAEVEQQLRREAAVTKASEDAQKNWANQSASTSIGNAQYLSWLGSDIATPAIAVKAMNLPVANLPALAVVADTDRVDVIRVVKEESLPPQQLAQMTQWAQSVWNTPNENLAASAYMAALRERMGVKLFPERIKVAQE